MSKTISLDIDPTKLLCVFLLGVLSDDLSSSERQRSAFVFDPGRGPRRSFNEPCAGSEAHIKVQRRLPELQRPRRYLGEHVDALDPKFGTCGAICGASPHSCAEKHQFELERRILAL
jgi:hypothetical protein